MTLFLDKLSKLFCLFYVAFFFMNSQYAYGVSKESLFVSLPTKGHISATFHPQATVIKGKLTRFSFGVPFPKKVLENSKKIRVIVNNQEVPSYTVETSRWHNFEDKSARFIRSVLVYTDIVFINHKPLNFTIEYGEDRTRSLDDSVNKNVKVNWASISKQSNSDEYPTEEYITEPPVYVTFSPDWLSACLLKTRSLKMGEGRLWKSFDNAVLNFAKTAVNDVSRFVKAENKIDYISNPAPWLYDRASVLYSVYFRTGDVKWLRHAHRATQFYANHINEKGYFDLKKSPDMKYSYGQSMMMGLMLMGDLSYIPIIERIASAGLTWPDNYTVSLNFWTERHLSYALLAAHSAWEATGKEIHRNRVKKLINTTLDMTNNPFNGRRKSIGCPLHTMKQHEGADSFDPYCSPWMGALLSDAMWKYYLLSEDKKALEFLAGLANFVVNFGLYKGKDTHLKNFVIPWYLASSLKTFSDDGAWGDVEHSCDVAGLVARGAWASKTLGQETVVLVKSANDLFKTCINKTLKNWHRGDALTTGQPSWRLAPPRKFNWWFGTNSDASWFMQWF